MAPARDPAPPVIEGEDGGAGFGSRRRPRADEGERHRSAPAHATGGRRPAARLDEETRDHTGRRPPGGCFHPPAHPAGPDAADAGPEHDDAGRPGIVGERGIEVRTLDQVLDVRRRALAIPEDDTPDLGPALRERRLAACGAQRLARTRGKALESRMPPWRADQDDATAAPRETARRDHPCRPAAQDGDVAAQRIGHGGLSTRPGSRRGRRQAVPLRIPAMARYRSTTITSAGRLHGIRERQGRDRGIACAMGPALRPVARP